MTVMELLSQLRRLGVELEVEDQRLRVNAPRGAVSVELRGEMARRKQEIIELLGRRGNGPARPALVPAARDGRLPLSYAQERLWFLDQLMPGNPAFNSFNAMRLRGALDLAALAAALSEVVRRHEVLRTLFPAAEGEARQEVMPPQPLRLPLVDLSTLVEARRQREARDRAEKESLHAFDLALEGPLRSMLLRLADNEYVVLLTVHHIAFDAWSMGLLWRELHALYGAAKEALAEERPRAVARSPLPGLPVQYADYAVWQRGWLTGEILAREMAYWRRQLGTEPPVLDLPADRPRPPAAGFSGAVVETTVSGALLDDLRRQEGSGTTLFMVLLTAFKVLLLRYSGQEDITVGTPITHRRQTELEGMIGLFLNTLVLRTNLAGVATFTELLSRVRAMALEAYDHQDIPFEKLLAELQPDRDPSRTPLFQVFFNLLDASEASIELPSLEVTPLSRSTELAKFDLTVYLMPVRDRLSIRVVYRTDLFDAVTMERLLSHYRLVLAAMAEQPPVKIDRLSLLTLREEALLPCVTAPLADDWRGAVHEFLALHAERIPDGLAVRGPAMAWSYQHFNERANRLAHHLRTAGVGSGDVVAIHAHRDIFLAQAILGVLKAGAAYAILDPVYPVARLLTCLELLAPRGFIALASAGELPAALASRLTEMPLAARLVLPREQLLARCSTQDPEITTTADTAACITFTSGSTGEPKGVVGRHGSLSHFLPWLRQRFDLSTDDRFVLLSALAHDPLQRDLFTPLQLGATLLVPDPDLLGQPQRLRAWLGEQRITVCHLTPALGQLLTGEDPQAEVPTLRRAFYIGDALREEDVARLRRLAPRVLVINLYGATETQRALSFFAVPESGGVDWATLAYPLGHGMAGAQLLVLGRGGQLAAIGEVGEIYIRSPHLARGYLHDDELTAERFRPNPFVAANAANTADAAGDANDRLYRTGDRGVYLTDGAVAFRGRADHQVQVRGFRVELGEIETVLRRDSDIAEAAVELHDDASGEPRLAAWVVPGPGRSLDLAQLRERLRRALPSYMVPTLWLELEALPRLPNHKLDRGALPSPVAGRETLAAAYVAPRSAVEEQLVEIWRELLGVERVGVHDNFFDLGGHSLLATRLVSRVLTVFGVELQLSRVFQTPTVAGMELEVTSQLVTEEGGEELTRMLQDMGDLSEEELAALLQDEAIEEAH